MVITSSKKKDRKSGRQRESVAAFPEPVDERDACGSSASSSSSSDVISTRSKRKDVVADLPLFTSAEPALAMLLALQPESISDVNICIAPSLLKMLFEQYDLKDHFTREDYDGKKGIMPSNEMKIIFEAIAGLQNIRRLSVKNFMHFTLPAKGVKPALDTGRSLRELSFDSIHFEGGRGDFVGLAYSISQHPSLEKLELANCSPMDGLEILLRTPKRFTSLKKLVVRNFEDPPISIEALGAAVQSATDLEELIIDDVALAGETADFEDFCALLKCHPLLKVFSLWDCWPVNPKASFEPLLNALPGGASSNTQTQ